MFKLLKYEFRKAMVSILVMLGVTAALEGYFLYGLYSEANDGVHAVIGALLLILFTLAIEIFVMVRGVTSFSGELKGRNAYLIFMTPNSALKIMASKYLFTLILGTSFTLMYVLLGYLDIRLSLEKYGEYQEFVEMWAELFKSAGIRVDQIIFAGVFAVIYFLLDFLVFYAVAYLAVTISHTLFRDKKWRWVMAILFYFAITSIVSFLNSLFPMVYTVLQFTEAPGVGKIAEAYGLNTAPTFLGLLVYLVPQMLISAGVILLSFFGCAWMLEKKVSL